MLNFIKKIKASSDKALQLESLKADNSYLKDKIASYKNEIIWLRSQIDKLTDQNSVEPKVQAEPFNKSDSERLINNFSEESLSNKSYSDLYKKNYSLSEISNIKSVNKATVILNLLPEVENKAIKPQELLEINDEDYQIILSGFCDYYCLSEKKLKPVYEGLKCLYGYDTLKIIRAYHKDNFFVDQKSLEEIKPKLACDLFPINDSKSLIAGDFSELSYQERKRWGIFKSKSIKNPFMYKHILEKQNGLCEKCTKPITDKSNATIHHINYKYICQYKSSDATEKDLKSANCDACSSLPECSENLVLVHKGCHIAIHSAEGRIQKKSKGNYDEVYWINKKGSDAIDLLTDIISILEKSSKRNITLNYLNSYIKCHEFKNKLHFRVERDFVELVISHFDLNESYLNKIKEDQYIDITEKNGNPRVRIKLYRNNFKDYVNHAWVIYSTLHGVN